MGAPSASSIAYMCHETQDESLMPTPRKTRRWLQIRRNTTLHRRVLVADAFGPDFPWHDQAHLPQSSQAFCVSAFGGLRQLDSRNQVISRFLSTRFPEVAVKAV